MLQEFTRFNIRIFNITHSNFETVLKPIIYERSGPLLGVKLNRVFRSRIPPLLGSLSTRVFGTRTVTGSELISLLTCPHTTTFILLSIFSTFIEISSVKIWDTIRSWNGKCSLPVAVRVSKARLLKLPYRQRI